MLSGEKEEKKNCSANVHPCSRNKSAYGVSHAYTNDLVKSGVRQTELCRQILFALVKGDKACQQTAANALPIESTTRSVRAPRCSCEENCAIRRISEAMPPHARTIKLAPSKKESTWRGTPILPQPITEALLPTAPSDPSTPV